VCRRGPDAGPGSLQDAIIPHAGARAGSHAVTSQLDQAEHHAARQAASWQRLASLTPDEVDHMSRAGITQNWMIGMRRSAPADPAVSRSESALCGRSAAEYPR